MDMKKEGKVMVFLFSFLMLFIAIAKFLGILPQIGTIFGVTIYFDRLAVAFVFFGIGGLIYSFWGK